MSPNNNAQVTYCSFPPPVPSTKFYTCYKKEACCQQGCCINGPYQVYQVWYYWLLFLIIFGVISGGSWLCKKPRAVPCRTVSRNAATSSRNSCCSHLSCNRRRCANYFGNNSERRECSSCEGNNGRDYEDNIILDRLFVSFRNRNTIGDPPSYSSILSSDCKNKPPAKFCPLYSYYGPPPTYSSMYKSSSDNTQQIIYNENLPNRSSAESAGSVIQIQVHAEEHVNKPATNSNNKNNAAHVVQTNHPEIIRDNTNVPASENSINISTSSNLTNANEGNQSTPENNKQLPSRATPENI